MGTWGYRPWENDMASDWFDMMMEETGLAEYVERSLHTEIDDDDPGMTADEIRAAAAVVLLLGHIFTWPVENWDQDLQLAISRLEEILAKDYAGGAGEQIRAEIALLKVRLERKDEDSSAQVKWWHFGE